MLHIYTIQHVCYILTLTSTCTQPNININVAVSNSFATTASTETPNGTIVSPTVPKVTPQIRAV